MHVGVKLQIGVIIISGIVSAHVMNLTERLDLQPKEINYLKLFEKGELQICGTKDYINSPTKKNLRLKLRLEACRRMWKQKLTSLPSDDDIELFCINLRNNSTYSRSEDGKLIDYCNYKLKTTHAFLKQFFDFLQQVMNLAPKALQDFLSAKTFMDLLQISNAKDEGRVPVDFIIDYLVTKKDKLNKLIHLHYYDSASKGYLSIEDLRDFLEAEVLPYIPSLANLNEEEPMLQDYYLCMATRKFFFFLDAMRQNKIRIVDIVASRLLEEFEALNESSIRDAGDDDEFGGLEQGTSQTAGALNWFSKGNCLRIKDMYEQLDTDGNGLLSFSEMTNFQRVTNSFMQRVFEVQQTYDNDELDLRGFCDLLLAMEYKSERSALSYYFRILDVDGDNLLTASDLNFFYRDISRMLADCFPDSSSQKPPLFIDVKNEIFDMCHPKNPKGITLAELVSSGNGGTVVGMLTDLDAFLEYENREDVVYEE